MLNNFIALSQEMSHDSVMVKLIMATKTVQSNPSTAEFLISLSCVSFLLWWLLPGLLISLGFTKWQFSCHLCLSQDPLQPGPKWTRNFPGREFCKESYEEWHNSEQSVKMFSFSPDSSLVTFFFFKGSDFIMTCGFKMLISVGEIAVLLAFDCLFIFRNSSKNSTEKEKN